jgi:S-adenosylmethionine:tRNA ribosyltransferase-isomerase
MPSFDETLALYDYAFPPDRIAQAPANPRDSARLLVYDRESRSVAWSAFRDIGAFLPKNAVLVLNKTKVVPARLRLTRATGGAVSALWLGADGEVMRALCNRRLQVGETLALAEGKSFTVEASAGKEWRLRPSFPIVALQEILERHGEMPLPPYIKKTPLSPEELRREYQTVFAEEAGSVAAPTASLHFTPELLASLEASGITLASVTLHVHLGTFAPLAAEQWERGELHAEEYRVPPETAAILERAKSEGRPIIAVGTTAVRTLESAADAQGRIVRPQGTTTLFIREGYTFRMADGIITNFHVPRSSLLMLVSAFCGRETLMGLYRQAIDRDFRLFSFGDGMLIL